MYLRAIHRLTTTFFVVLSLLFSQLALASYVCPPDELARTAAKTVEVAQGGACEDMDMSSGRAMDIEQPVLCHQHCANAPLSLDLVQATVVSLPAVVQVFVVPLVMDAGASESVAFAEAARERPPPDPLFLSTLRLRV